MPLLLGFVKERIGHMPTFSLTKAAIWAMQTFSKGLKVQCILL